MRIRKQRGEIKTTCSKCDGPLEETRVYKYRYCRGCHAANMRENRLKYKELPDIEKKKAKARSYAKEMVKRGVIIKTPCVKCGSLKAEMHHEDYDKPMEVIWLCKPDHVLLHLYRRKSIANNA